MPVRCGLPPGSREVHRGEVSRRSMRGTSPQGMLPAGNVATLEPISTLPLFEGLWRWGNGPGDALARPAGFELYSRLLANRIKEMFSEAKRAARSQVIVSVARSINLRNNLGSIGCNLLQDVKPFSRSSLISVSSQRFDQNLLLIALCESLQRNGCSKNRSDKACKS